MSYLTYSPATNKYPVRGFSNPNFTQSPDAIIPTSIPLTYQSDGDTNGLFYWYGTTGNTVSWTNPVTADPTLAVLLGSNTAAGGGMTTLVDRTGGQYVYINGVDGNHARVVVTPPGRQFMPNGILLRAATVAAASAIRNFNVVGWNAGGSYTTGDVLLSITGTTLLDVGDSFAYFSINNSTFYDNVAYVHLLSANADKYLRLGEIEFYGELTTI